MTARILIIAGSDSGGGAGIQADIKTVTMLGGHAMTAITAITAQNTLGVEGVLPIPPKFVVQQMAAVAEDIGVDAVKIGMLGGRDTVEAVAQELLSGLYDGPVIFDPVMVATSGAPLADNRTIEGMARLARLSTVVTPNLPELAVLCGVEFANIDQAVVGAIAYAGQIGATVLIKGGHAEGEQISDVLVNSGGVVRSWTDARIPTTSTHGTGCTLASAIATGLGQGLDLEAAISRARQFVRAALHAAPGLGSGHGPMGHQAVDVSRL